MAGSTAARAAMAATGRAGSSMPAGIETNEAARRRRDSPTAAAPIVPTRGSLRIRSTSWRSRRP